MDHEASSINGFSVKRTLNPRKKKGFLIKKPQASGVPNRGTPSVIRHSVNQEILYGFTKYQFSQKILGRVSPGKWLNFGKGKIKIWPFNRNWGFIPNFNGDGFTEPIKKKAWVLGIKNSSS